MKSYYVYILSNTTNSVFYIGMTNDLPQRIYQHREHLIKGFTDKYNCTRLLYYEITDDVHSAIAREKKLKRWPREWKENLIREFNPAWKDLYNDL